jgi:divalent metal cation (Fe/Co/Zn/Cd) transporter
MEDNLPLVQAHVIADQVEQAILRRFPGMPGHAVTMVIMS